LGVTVTPLGSAELDTSGDTPVAQFPITGGTEEPDAGNDVILHQGSGLELSDSSGTLDLSDFRIDTANGVVDANVTANGQSAGNLAVFDIGSDGTTLTLTDAAASAADTVLGTSALSSSVEIGTAAPSPIVNPLTLGIVERLLSFIHPPSASVTNPIVGGETAVTLTSAPALSSLGVTVTPLGSAALDASGTTPVADFPITGGTEGPGAGNDVVLHQGSGLELSDSNGSLDLRDFLIDAQNGVVNANVTVNGQSAGNLPVFDIGNDGTSLTLTSAAAGVVDQVLGTSAITSSTIIGTAAPSPVALPGGLASVLADLSGHGVFSFHHG
jgi:phage gp45-like